MTRRDYEGLARRSAVERNDAARETWDGGVGGVDVQGKKTSAQSIKRRSDEARRMKDDAH